MGVSPAAQHDDFTEWKASVEARLRQALARGANRPALQLNNGDFVVSNNGQLRVEGSGGLSLVSGDNVEIFSAKGWGAPYLEPDGDPQPMTIMRRADGSVAFFLGDPLPAVDGYQQFWALYDRSGNVIFGDDTTSGLGLARPYMSYEVQNENANAFVTLTSTTTFADAHTIAGFVQNPRMTVPVTAIAPATGAGEVRIWHGGTSTVCAGPTVIPTGGSVAPFYTFDVPPGIPLFTHQYFAVQTRRTTGTGNIQSRAWSAHGVQS